MRLDYSVGDAFRFCSVGTQFHADTANDGITLPISVGAASEEVVSSTKGEGVVDLWGYR